MQQPALFLAMPESILKQLEQRGTVQITGLRGSSPAWLAGLLSKERRCCCILADEHQVSIFEQDLRLFTDGQILTYPGYEIPPYTQLSPDQKTTAARLSTLYQLREMAPNGVMISSIEALLRKVIPQKLLHRAAELVMAAEECDRDELLDKLDELGYEQVGLAQNVGDVAVRGGIVDVYPPPFITEDYQMHEGPIRLDFFGDVIESIRPYDPISQRSSGELEEAILLPVHDIVARKSSSETVSQIIEQFSERAQQQGWDEKETARIIDRLQSGRRFAGMEFFLPLFYPDFVPEVSTVFDYLPSDLTVVLIDPESIFQQLSLVTERIENNFKEASATLLPALNPSEIFLGAEELHTLLENRPSIICSDFIKKEIQQHPVSTSSHQLLKQAIALERTKRGLIAPLSDQIYQWQNNHQRVVLCCRSARHTQNLAELLSKHQHTIELLEPPLDLRGIMQQEDKGQLLLCNHPLANGFSFTEKNLHILSESELFGEMRLGARKKGGRVKGDPVRFTELANGDIVVHRDHGLGIYQGLQTITVQNIINDFMLIEYRDGDRLYLPVDRLNLITRYEGLIDRQPQIDKLGSQNWKVKKLKVKEEVWKIAQELLHIYAKREMQHGKQFSSPSELYHELEESFPFDETSGQHRAIDDVLSDLTSDKPMDRLVCGDVGYGKTEVAIRGAFKVVEDNMQVAILVPTTVLAEQHNKTFKERLAGFPVTVACINRFRTPAQQRKILKQLADGTIDILIGTHRLLSKDVVFKDLGLLIVDEEHRFGVSHKEKIKKMRASVDILTLTATPIPRTLQMSLLSIRDLSVISSPPEQRRPIKTFIARYDTLVIKEAITRELRRNGQVFFIHNRVKSIQKTASEIQSLVPDARIAIAHGQMGGKELEDIMVRFVNRDIDVLVCTTIVESGLDIPTANTIVINRADQLGLAEIYQLRGRVGRSSVQSFAYLLVPSIDSLTKDSRDRLQALMDCNELGGGFKLAMSDLQIRGGGNLLGVSQSGQIAAIGYDLYLDLLQKTVADLKARALQGDIQAAEEIEPEINLQLSAYIPETYMSDISQRYITYRRIAALTSGDDTMYDDLQEELTDRYGPLPKETKNLFQIVLLKKSLTLLRINKLDKGPDTLVFSFMDDTPITPQKILQFLQNQPQKNSRTQMKLTPDGRLVVKATINTTEKLFSVAATTVSELRNLLDETG